MPYHDKTSLSQNFIKYPELVRELLTETDITKNDTLLEIGPGFGVITRELCHYSAQVIAIEKDEVLGNNLINSTKNIPNLKIIIKDFLKYRLPTTSYKVFANIPFAITSEIVTKFLNSPLLPDSMYFLMQLETAQKFVGSPETLSSLLAKPWYEIKIIGDIDRSNFTKKPQVQIVFIEFKKRPFPFIKDENKADYYDFVNYGFKQWQPSFLDSYKKLLTYPQLKKIEKTFKVTGLKLTQVSFDTWLQIFKTYLKLC